MTKSTVRLLGSTEIRDAAGREPERLPRQPKRLGLLAYLAIARPREFHRRDKLVALFWPEASHEQARHALSQALHIIRSELGEAAVRGRGDSDVAIDDDLIWCDVLEFESALEDGEYENALELYRGDLLEGLFVRDAPEFERWLDDERTRLREKAAGAAWALAHEHISAGRLVDAERTAQRALQLVLTDEGEVRRFIQALAGAGDRAAGVRFYDKFANRLRSEYEIEPDPVTVTVAHALARTAPHPQRAAKASGETVAPAPASVVTPNGMTPTQVRSVSTAFGRSRKLRIAIAASAAVMAVTAAAILIPRWNAQALDPNRVLVVALEDESGRQEMAALGRMAQAYIIDILTDAGFATVVDPLTALAVSRNVAAASVAPAAEQVLAQAHEARAGTVVSGSYYAAGDSIEIQTRITDVNDGSVMETVGPLVGTIGARSELVTRLGREVVAALAPLLDRELGSLEPAVRPATFEAYQAYSEGLEAFLQDRPEKMVEAGRLFEQALAADSTFHSARLWAAHAYQVAGRAFEWSYYAKADSLIATLIESRAQLTRYERCRLDLVTALGPRLDLSGAYEAAQCMVEQEPGSEHAKRELAILTYRFNRPAAAIEILGELDPDRGLMQYCNCYWPIQQNAYLMLGDYEGALEAGRRQRERSPEDIGWEVAPLAALGRLDEVAANLEARRSLPPQETFGGYLVSRANILHTHGHRDVAREIFDEAIAWYRSRPDSVQSRAQLAWPLYIARRWDDAQRLFEELAEEDPENSGHLYGLGLLAARRGDRAEALRIREELRPAERPLLDPGYTLFQAKIAALLGDHAEAMTLLQRAIELGVNWGHGVWLLYDIDIQALNDYPPFQEFMRPKG